MTRTTSVTHGTSQAPTIEPRPSSRYDRYRALVCNLSEVVTRGAGPTTQARSTLERIRSLGIQVELSSKPAALLAGTGFVPSETLVLTGSLDDTAAARRLGFDSLFLLGRANGLRDVALCGAAVRPTYVAMDIRTLEHPPAPGRPQGDPPATLSSRGRVELRRPLRAAPQDLLDAALDAVQRARDKNKLMLTGRSDLWRPLEVELRDYWNRWVDRTTGVTPRVVEQ
jgi:hypothetical protein